VSALSTLTVTGSRSPLPRALASHDQLDFTIGTDNGGSLRRPAGVNSAQCPSRGLISLEGIIAATDLFATVGIFAEEVDIFTHVGPYRVSRAKPPPYVAEKRRYNHLSPPRAPQTDMPIVILTAPIDGSRNPQSTRTTNLKKRGKPTPR
jgi:Asp-tRNA(Asn)/Glu-tRNA(Gln) amidotransferase A subunit family amidase